VRDINGIASSQVWLSVCSSARRIVKSVAIRFRKIAVSSRCVRFIAGLTGVFTLFAATGYLLSDDLFFERLIGANHLTTPEDVFRFVQAHTSYPAEDMNVVVGSSPRYMLTEQRYLYCDQSAILMATIVHKLGYRTTLIDLVGSDDESHHTVLGVLQDGRWKAYDLTNNLQGRPIQESARYQPGGQPYQAQPSFRTYPGFYHWLVQNNFYLKHLALWWRGLPG
jgi:hypothetical protein